MKVDWAALGIVAVVSISATVLFVIFLATSIRLLSAARIKANQGQSATATLTFGYALLGLAALLVLFCIYLIVPQFR
jgi:heme O synthase-like polyprenyltransferase